MAVRTSAELNNLIATLLADNNSGDISPLDIRSVFTDMVDSLAFSTDIPSSSGSELIAISMASTSPATGGGYAVGGGTSTPDVDIGAAFTQTSNSIWNEYPITEDIERDRYYKFFNRVGSSNRFMPTGSFKGSDFLDLAETTSGPFSQDSASSILGVASPRPDQDGARTFVLARPSNTRQILVRSGDAGPHNIVRLTKLGGVNDLSHPQAGLYLPGVTRLVDVGFTIEYAVGATFATSEEVRIELQRDGTKIGDGTSTVTSGLSTVSGTSYVAQGTMSIRNTSDSVVTDLAFTPGRVYCILRDTGTSSSDNLVEQATVTMVFSR